jgi:hypothetical protein
MDHDLEFQEPNAKGNDKAALELASLYVRTFSTPDGKRVLADLFKKLDPSRSRFSMERPNSHSAARIEGQCDVWREISNAITVGGAASLLSTLK